MAQFDVHRNRNPASRARFPLLLDIQSDLLDPLATRVVVPLVTLGQSKVRRMDTLTPVLRFEGKDYVMSTPQLAGIPARELGPVMGSLAGERGRIVAALDFLIAGV